MMYVVINGSEVIRQSDGKTIAPCHSDIDADYIDYLAWIGNGNTPIQIDAIPPLRKISVDELRARFTNQETDLMMSKQFVDAQISNILTTFAHYDATQSLIDLDSDKTIQMLSYLAYSQCLQQYRIAEIRT